MLRLRVRVSRCATSNFPRWFLVVIIIVVGGVVFVFVFVFLAPSALFLSRFSVEVKRGPGGW